MGLLDLLGKLRPRSPDQKYARMLAGQTPVFSQFGENIYASDLVQICIDRIATECKKLKPKHIRTDDSGMQRTVNGSINRLLRISPNPMMTTSDFLEKVIWLLYLNYNAFIYTAYYLDQNGSKVYTGFYPLDPKQVTFMEDPGGRMFIEMMFANGYKSIIPYDNVIHLRKKFSVNEVMGGGSEGQPDNAALLKALRVNDALVQGLEKGVKASLAVRGILKMNTFLASEEQLAELAKLEAMITNNTSGIIPLDLASDLKPITVDPKMIDKETLEYMEGKVLKWYGCSAAIVSGDYTDVQYQSFYEGTLEGLLISLGQAFSKTLFTQRELDMGNELIFYPQELMFSSMNNKVLVADILGNRGALTNNALLGIFGWPPYEGGDERMVSLNFINAKYATEYQLKKAGIKDPSIGSTDDAGVVGTGQVVDAVENVTNKTLNGAQVQSLIGVVQSFKQGVLSKNAAIELIVSAFGMSKDSAERILEDAVDTGGEKDDKATSE